MDEDAGRRAATPLLVLVSGPPGTGKSTLARKLAAALEVFRLERDEVWDGLRFTSARDPTGGTPHGIPVWFDVIALLMSRGVSLVADGTLYRGEDEQRVADLVHRGEVVNVHCRCAESLERFRARKELDGVSQETLNALLSRVESDDVRVTEPLELGCRSVVVDTTEGYRPPLEALLDQLVRTPE